MNDGERAQAEALALAHRPPRLFVLDRREDVTGVSSALLGRPAVGVVAWGVAFPDGVCVTRWCVSEVRQTCVWASLDDLLAVHGHEGRTVLRWL